MGLMDCIVWMMEKRWPGVKDVVGLMAKIEDRVSDQYIEGLSELDAKKSLYQQFGQIIAQKPSAGDAEDQDPTLFKEEDGVWRPTVLLLSLIYKIQKIMDDHWYDDPAIFVPDKKKVTTIVELLARYWWYQMDVVKHVRGDDDDKVKENLVSGLDKASEDILYVYTKDTKDDDLLMQHTPDMVLLVEHGTKEVILNVCGTKMFPVPSMADILMDLYCENAPFHQGHAHQGMAAACNNILAMVLDTLAAKLQQWPDYKLVILGYSLGAGVAELLTIELTKGESAKKLPESTTVLGVSFGSPPVYAHSSPGFVLPNLISVYNHNDGLAAASLHTVTKLFLQIKAIERIGLNKRTMLRMLRRKLGHSEIAPGSSVRRHVMNDDEKTAEWDGVLRALRAVDRSGFVPLEHVAGVTYLIKRHAKRQEPVGDEHEEFVVRRLEGGVQVAPLAADFRLRGGMFNDHMPWGYGGLFEGCGGNVDGVTFDNILSLIAYA